MLALLVFDHLGIVWPIMADDFMLRLDEGA